MVRKLAIASVVASAAASGNRCDSGKIIVNNMNETYQEFMKTQCGVDAHFETCHDLQSDPSTGKAFDMMVTDSRGMDLIVTSQLREATNPKGDMIIQNAPHCNDDAECVKEFLCKGPNNDAATLKASAAASMPVRSGVVVTEEQMAEAAAELAAHEAAFKGSFEEIVSDRMDLVRRWIHQSEVDVVDNSEIIEGEPSEEQKAEAEAINAQKYLRYVELLTDETVDYRMNEETHKVERITLPSGGLLKGAQEGKWASLKAELLPSSSGQIGAGNAVMSMSDMKAHTERLMGSVGRGPRDSDFSDSRYIASVNALLPRSFDPRENRRDSSLPDTRGCFGPEHVRDQGQCGSCWAFAAVAEIHARSCMRNGRPLRAPVNNGMLLPSPQAMVSCAPTSIAPHPSGCMGNSLESMIDVLPFDSEYPYMLRNWNQPNENKDYWFPYDVYDNQRSEECRKAIAGSSSDVVPVQCIPKPPMAGFKCNKSQLNSGRVKTDITTTKYGTVNNDKTRIAAVKGILYHHGSMRIMMRAHNAFMSYFTGATSYARGKKVYQAPPGESTKDWSGTHNYHAVTINGWGTDTNGREFWLIQNSWGYGWGDNGYFRAYMDDPILTLNIYSKSRIFWSNIRYVNTNNLPSGVSGPPTKVSLSKQLRFYPFGAYNMFQVNCDTDCFVHSDQPNPHVKGGFKMARSILPKDTNTHKRFLFIDPPAYTVGQPLTDGENTVVVRVWKTAGKFIDLQLNLPKGLLVVKEMADTHRQLAAKKLADSTDYVLDLPRLCPNRNAIVIGQMRKFCRLMGFGGVSISAEEADELRAELGEAFNEEALDETFAEAEAEVFSEKIVGEGEDWEGWNAFAEEEGLVERM